MDQMRKDFVEGCYRASGIHERLAHKLFDLIDYFSGYGFNRSHSAAYALISYQTAYLKANFPVEFMCALLTSEKDNTDKIVEYVKESEVMGIRVLPPDINSSIKEFSVVDEKAIRFGLLAVKNVGSTAIDLIIEDRAIGSYRSLFDLCERVDLRLVNKKVLESLIKCGALDSFGAYRAQWMTVLERALESGAKKQKEKSSGQVSFFDFGADSGSFRKEAERLPEMKEWPQPQILAFEREILGFYISGHPLSHYQTEIKEFTDISTRNLRELVDGQEVRLVGIINQVKLTSTKKTNERMAILQLEDMEGEVEVVVFPSAYANLAQYIKEGEVILLKGRVSFRDDSPKIIASDFKYMADIYGTIKDIRLDLSKVGEDGLKEIRKKLSHFPGKVPVYLNLNTRNYKSVQILVGEDLFVLPSEPLISELKDLVGKENLSVSL